MSLSTIPNQSDRSRWLLYKILTRLNQLVGIAGPTGATGAQGPKGDTGNVDTSLSNNYSIGTTQTMDSLVAASLSITGKSIAGPIAINNSIISTVTGIAGAFCVGGNGGNVATGNASGVLGGDNNQATGIYSLCEAGNWGRASIKGQRVHSGGLINVGGDVQASDVILYANPADATATELIIGNSDRIVLPNSSAWNFEVKVVARKTGATGSTAYFRITGLIIRDANAASTSIVGSVADTPILSAGAAGWSFAVDADTTNGALRLKFTGQAATTVAVVAQVNLVETKG